MFSEKSRLTDKRENPFYGSYKEYSNLEEAHWQNKKKKQQLTIVTVVVLVLIALAIGITLAITLPSILGKQGDLDPPNPLTYLGPSPSVLGQYTEAAISTESSLCTDIGNKVLQELDGSAVDAAVAAALCIGVVAPQSSGLGGGLFMTIYDPETEQVYAINARETAPMLLQQFETRESKEGGQRMRQSAADVGAPGELAGLYEAHKRFGKVAWAELVKFSSDLAQNGFPVSYNLANSLKKHSDRVKSDPGLSSELVNASTGEVYQEGETLKRPRLATTLQTIGNSGMESFYNGTIAEMIEEELSSFGSLINRDDLAAYSVDWQTPVSYTMSNNLTMYGTSLPSGAPVALLALRILDGFGRQQPLNMSLLESSLDAHRFVETLKFTSVHRSQTADPEFAPMDDLLKKLVSAEYADELRSRIDPYKSFNDPAYYGGVFSEGPEAGTAHISVIGPDGDACSLSTSINTGFGIGYMGKSTGIIYNDQLDDFSMENITKVYGLPPNHYNFPEPGKRPASSLSPLIFLNEEKQPVFVIGGTGGSKILPAVISTAWRALYREMDIKTAADHPRFTVSFDPSEVLYEYGTPAPIVTDLERRGHVTKRVDLKSYIGNVNSVCRTKRSQLILANADFRKRGASAGF